MAPNDKYVLGRTGWRQVFPKKLIRLTVMNWCISEPE